MPVLLNFWFPKKWYFLNCDNTELKTSCFFFLANGIAGRLGVTNDFHDEPNLKSAILWDSFDCNIVFKIGNTPHIGSTSLRTSRVTHPVQVAANHKAFFFLILKRRKRRIDRKFEDLFINNYRTGKKSFRVYSMFRERYAHYTGMLKKNLRLVS